MKIIRRAKVRNFVQSNSTTHLTTQIAEKAQQQFFKEEPYEMELKTSKDPRENEMLQAVSLRHHFVVQRCI